MTDKIALVTGASQGIGKQIALSLGQKGIRVIINYSKSKDQAEMVLSEIVNLGGKGYLAQADVSNPDEVMRMFSEIGTYTDKIDFLINNAGIDIPQPLETFDFDHWQKIINVNLNGKFFVLSSALPFLKKSPTPRVVNVASRLAWKALDEASAYCCSEAGIIMLTKCATLEFAKYGIKVNAVCPGMTRTPMTESIYPDETIWVAASEANPSGRVGSPIDVANAVIFLLSDEAIYINGTHILVDGGSSLK